MTDDCLFYNTVHQLKNIGAPGVITQLGVQIHTHFMCIHSEYLMKHLDDHTRQARIPASFECNAINESQRVNTINLNVAFLFPSCRPSQRLIRYSP